MLNIVPQNVDQENSIPFVDLLSDDQLDELNGILNWRSFLLDSQERRFGRPHSSAKRATPQVIPDKRIVWLDELIDLSDKRVLEVGCFEGHHTVALCQRAKSVTAIDSRVENVVKTMVRLGFANVSAQVLVCDVEDLAPDASAYLKCDVIHHVGVLYHLRDPVSHLLQLHDVGARHVMLDTHYAESDHADREYESNGRVIRYKQHGESGYQDVFSGMYDHAKWLLMDDLLALLAEAGFAQIQAVETRTERNGPRALILARR